MANHRFTKDDRDRPGSDLYEPNLANAPERICEACEAEPVWRLGDCGLCLTCCKELFKGYAGRPKHRTVKRRHS